MTKQDLSWISKYKKHIVLALTGTGTVAGGVTGGVYSIIQKVEAKADANAKHNQEQDIKINTHDNLIDKHGEELEGIKKYINNEHAFKLANAKIEAKQTADIGHIRDGVRGLDTKLNILLERNLGR